MRFQVAIVICMVVILEMAMKANAIRGVHAEYIRRRWAQGQSAAVNRHQKLPAGVHAEYIRRRRIEGQSAAAKIHDELPARQHRRQPTPRFQPLTLGSLRKFS
jgi:hypothetical protein